MLLEISRQFNVVIYSLIAGLIVGILFDMYRIIRNLRSIQFIVIVEDILFWILAGLVVFTFLLYINYALFTPYVYMFIIIALLLYFKFLSNLFYSTEKKVVDFLAKFIRVVLKKFTYPLKIIIYKVTDKNK